MYVAFKNIRAEVGKGHINKFFIKQRGMVTRVALVQYSDF